MPTRSLRPGGDNTHESEHQGDLEARLLGVPAVRWFDTRLKEVVLLRTPRWRRVLATLELLWSVTGAPGRARASANSIGMML
jgi:hypothetical protein